MTTKEVHRTAEALCRAWSALHTLPPTIVAGYKKMLQGEPEKIRLHLFELLWAKCPEAARIFYDDSGKIETDDPTKG